MTAAELLRQASAIYAETGLTPDDLAKRVREMGAELNEYRDAVSACEGGNLCRCSIEFPACATGEQQS